MPFIREPDAKSDGWNLYRVQTKGELLDMSSRTGWCTRQTDAIDHYMRDGSVLFVLKRQKDREGKYLLHVSGENYQLCDKENKPVDIEQWADEFVPKFKDKLQPVVGGIVRRIRKKNQAQREREERRKARQQAIANLHHEQKEIRGFGIHVNAPDGFYVDMEQVDYSHDPYMHHRMILPEFDRRPEDRHVYANLFVWCGQYMERTTVNGTMGNMQYTTQNAINELVERIIERDPSVIDIELPEKPEIKEDSRKEQCYDTEPLLTPAKEHPFFAGINRLLDWGPR